jgi:hypothetical protein
MADNVHGLRPKDDVMIKGMKVGMVKDISFVNDGSGKISIVLLVEKNIKVPVGSKARIANNETRKSGLIEIIPVKADLYMENDDTLEYVRNSPLIDDDSVEPLKEKTEEMLNSFDTLVKISEMLAEYNDEINQISNEKSGDSIVYRIQILTTERELKAGDPRFKGLSDIWKYSHNGVNKYTTAYTTNYETAIILKEKLRNNGYPQAFVVAFKGEVKVNVLDAKKLSRCFDPIIKKEWVKSNQGLVFKIQIAASQVELNEAQIKRICCTEKYVYLTKEDNWYKYSIGDFKSYNEALKLKEILSVDGAFIVAYNKEDKLRVKEAINLINK